MKGYGDSLYINATGMQNRNETATMKRIVLSRYRITK
jgi:hypothetical protein